jgi:CheY-like chemotaxis protein
MGVPERVMLAEDDADIRRLVARTLETEFEYEGDGSGSACWERLQTGEPPDVLLLDVTLPGMDGDEVFERVRRSDRLTDVTVIFMTGRGEADILDLVGEDVDYVRKPFSPSDLRERLRELECQPAQRWSTSVAAEPRVYPRRPGQSRPWDIGRFSHTTATGTTSTTPTGASIRPHSRR